MPMSCDLGRCRGERPPLFSKKPAMALSSSSTLLPRLLQASAGLGMRSSSSQAALRTILSKELSEIRAAGTFKKERVITTPQAASIHVQEREGDLLNFCANNYLGLSVRMESDELGLSDV